MRECACEVCLCEQVLVGVHECECRMCVHVGVCASGLLWVCLCECQCVGVRV